MKNNTWQKAIAIKLTLLLSFQLVFPTLTFALTGGPSQPEVESFEPIGTSEMVDLFSGDFTYNIPLLDVEGYPINLSYHSGITMDQEASWVGLGWNVNAGVINRGVRGLPDDFRGDKVTTRYNTKMNRTVGVGASADFELLGFSGGEFTLTGRLDLSRSNYSGWSSSIGITPGINAGIGTKGKLNASLGITGSSSEGASVQPSIGLSRITNGNNKTDSKTFKNSLGISFGGSFNSREGFKSLSVSLSANRITDVYFKKGNRNKSSGNSIGQSTGSTYTFGPSTYSPSSEMNYKGFSLTGEFSVGLEVSPAFTGGSLSGYVSKQYLATTERSTPAYGYLFSEMVVDRTDALMDFNRENDGAFSEATPALPLTNHTYDIFSVSGQGVGGSYRPFRGNVGTVHDPTYKADPDDSYSLEVEVGTGSVAKFGGSLGFTRSNSYGGRWQTGFDNAANHIRYKQGEEGSLYEPVYFKEAGEMCIDANEHLFEQMGGSEPVKLSLTDYQFDVKAGTTYVENNGETHSIANLVRTKREKRDQVFQYLNQEEALNYGVMSEDYYTSQPPREDHHIAEITTLNTDGTRYVYALPAYNTFQEEITFAIGRPISNENHVVWDYAKGLVGYNISGQNDIIAEGIDNYYSSVETPPFAHSYMLSTVLSSDYVDSDGVRGPSANDFGNFTVFSYDIKEDYKWRTPFEENQANYSEGLKTDVHDDKASLVYGKKDLCYLKTIESRNYVAVFETKPRKDARGVAGRHGGPDPSVYDNDDGFSHGYMMYLDNIKLFTRSEYEIFLNSPQDAVPIKTVHFEYDYSLCEGIPNFTNFTDPNTGSGEGKLTLKKVYFTYQNSEKARYSYYEFEYGANNPGYNMKGYDRWGNYKMNIQTTYPGPLENEFYNGEYPYTPQNQNIANSNSSAWHLEKIILPSGGAIEITYESDDYSTVQDKSVMLMTPILGTCEWNNGPVNIDTQSGFNPEEILISNSNSKNRLLRFQMEPNSEISDYISPGDQLFYRAMVNFGETAETATMDNCEFIPGYADVENAYKGTDGYGYILLKPEKLKDSETTAEYSPIVKTALQFARMNLKEVVYSGDVDGEDGQFQQAVSAIAEAAVSLGELFSSPNIYLYDKGIAKNIISSKSQIRLRIPGKTKLGGGVRVKKIEISDSWDGASGTVDPNANLGTKYGQEYEYLNEDGTSSGVASYEPQIGGEENPFKYAEFGSNNLKGAPDEKFYQERPYGESFFPSASVGYARVVVKNIHHEQVTRHATGQVVHEFYTARDFPTIAKETEVEPIRHKNPPHSIQSLLKLNVKDYMTASQGFVVETNDMHGKPKSQKVYAENGSSPISGVMYFYKREDMGNATTQNGVTTMNSGSGKLTNNCKVIHRDGTIEEDAQLGVVYDVVNDQRESRTKSKSFEAKGNLDVTPLFGISIPSVWPTRNIETTQFRSITTTKVIQRFGILEKTVAIQDGSVVSTENLAYDAETGDVLVTKTVTDFDDAVYSVNFPAYWHYREMGPAAQNIGFEREIMLDASGKAPVTNAPMFYAEGDELALAGGEKVWVTELAPTYIKVMKEAGNPPVAGTYLSKIIRSGFRNMQLGSMANVTMRVDPVEDNQIANNLYQKVLQASAIEYQNEWPTACNCMNGEENIVTTNPYVRGTKGYWKPSKSFLHLAGRTQSDFDNNTNIREDGTFTSYNPFYYVDGDGVWHKDYANWTYTSEVSLFSPYGPELENRDALGRYSAAAFGYHQTLPTAVAANSQYREMGFESFEDYIIPAGGGTEPILNCNDTKFRINDFDNTGQPSEGELSDEFAHTGRYSLRVDGSVLSAYPVPEPCGNGACEMTVSINNNTLNNDSEIWVSTGAASISYNISLLSGSASNSVINPNTGLHIISIDASLPWMAMVTITDANGNEFSEIIGN